MTLSEQARCTPHPAAAPRRWSPSSAMFMRRGHITVHGDVLEVSDGRRVHTWNRADIVGVQHRYRPVLFGYGAEWGARRFRVLAGEIVFLGRHTDLFGPAVLATVPGGWAGNERYSCAEPCILPGWWRHDEVAAVLAAAGLPLSEVGVVELAGGTYSPAIPMFSGRPLPPACFHAVDAFFPYLAGVLGGWLLLAFPIILGS